MRHSSNIKFYLMATLAIWLAWALATPLAADDNTRPTQKTMMVRGETDQQLPKVTVTIEKKSTGRIVTHIGDSYAVSSETMIVNPDGRQVSIRKMLVPCEAEVTYATDQGTLTARRIDIKHIADNARWQSISERPE